jgi:hypothetical protein
MVKLNGMSPISCYAERLYSSGTNHIGEDSIYVFSNVDEMAVMGTIEMTNVFNGSTTGVKTITRTISFYFEPSEGAAPTGLNFTYDETQNKMLLNGVDSTMEYKDKTDYPNTWQDCTDAPMYFDIPNSYIYYYIRYKQTTQNGHSNIAQVTLMNRPSLSSLTYNRNEESINNIESNMHISINGGAYTETTDSTYVVSDLIDDLDTGETATVTFMIPATTTRAASNPKTFTIYPRLPSPTSVTYDPANVSLSGTNSSMEYRLSTASSWTSISASSVSLKSFLSATEDKTVYVRNKATTTNAASEHIEFTIPMLLDGPSCTLNTFTETISGFENGVSYQYTTSLPSSATSWISLNVSNGVYSPSSLISTSTDRVIYIRKAKTSTTPETNYTAIAIPQRDASPSNLTINYTDPDNYDAAVIDGVSNAMEYRLSTSSEWQSVTNNTLIFEIPSSSVSYYVRTKATESNFASSHRSFTIYSRASAPSCSYSTTTETITGLSTTREISINGSEYELSTGTSLSLSDYIDEIESDETLVILVRTAASSTHPASAIRTFTVLPRLATPTGVTYNPVTMTLSGTSSSMQYKLSTATSWSSISSSTVNLKSLASSTSDVVVELRYKPTNSASASQIINFTVAQLLPGPDCEIDYINQKLTGLSNDIQYQYYIGSSPSSSSSWTNMTVVDGAFDLTSLITTSNRIFNIRKSETTTSPYSNYTTLTISAKPVAPTTPTFIYNDSDNYDMAVLSGVNSTMEFRPSNVTEWTTVSDSNRVFDIPTSNITYYVRYKSTDTAFASRETSFYLLKRSSAPGISYNTTTEILSGLTSAREISYNDGIFTTSSTSSADISEMITDLDDTETLVIRGRTAATQTAPASSMVTITVKPRLSSPANVSFNSAAIALSGTTTSMQYRLSTASSWTTATANTLNLNSLASQTADTIILLRYTPTSNNSASLPVQFTIPQLLTGPVCSVDYINESISGLNDDYSYQYIIGSNPSITGSWINAPVTNGNFDLSSIISTSSKVINIRKAETESSPVTHYTTFSLPARSTAPSTPAFTYNNPANYGMAVLSGINDTMEYCLSTSSTWTPITTETIVFEIPEANQTYYVRYKSTSTTFASRNRSITLSKSGNAPGSSYNTTTETISSLSTSYEISLNGGAYSSCTASTMLMTDYINSNTPGSILIVSIRTSATSSQPASLIKTITIYPRQSTPSSVTYNAAAIALNNTASGMQYRLTTSTSWTSITTSTVNLKQLVNATNDVSIELRFSPSSTNSASLPVTFTIPHLLSGPDGFVDYANEAISGLSTDREYQYYIGASPSINSTSWLSANVIDGKFDLSSIVTSSSNITINLRFAETATLPISNHTAFSVSGRPSAPNTVSFVYNNALYPNQAVLAGATTDMEWRISTDSAWTSIESLDVAFSLPTSNTTYYVRTKPSATSLASSNKSITLRAAGTAPTSYYNSATETIMGVSTSMEISINNSGYTDVTSSTYSLSDALSLMETGETLIVTVRYKATSTNPASQVTTLTITKT